MEKEKVKNKRSKVVQTLLFFGLLFSESRCIIDFYGLFQTYQVPNFTIFFLLLAVSVSTAAFVSQFQNPEPSSAFLLQFCQSLGLVVSRIILITVINIQSQPNSKSLICLLLFLAQNLIVIAKISYFGSVLQGQIAQNSNLLRLVRVLKITLVSSLPIFVGSKTVLVIVFAILQSSQALIFCLKFTYQQTNIEYILMIGVIGGGVSAVEAIVQLFTETPHFFLGQFIMLGFFFFPGFSLISLLEIKYLRIVTYETLKENSQTILILFRFMRECLLPDEGTLQFSLLAKGKCWIFFVELLKMKQSETKYNQRVKMEQTLWQQLTEDSKFLQKQFFELLCRNFKQTTHFQSFAFKVECALKMEEKYIRYCLIMYYQYIQSIQNNRNALETVKLDRIYNQITNRIYEKKSDLAPTHFINFDSLLENLRSKINQCVDFQADLIKYISRQKITNLQADDLLVRRSRVKQEVHNSILDLLRNNLYVDSNQFKYLFLVFHLSILKEPQLMVSLIKNYFSCKEANQKLVDSTFDYFIILDGSNNGLILNCNQNFKNKFKLNSQLIYNDKATISKLFPTVVQAKAHIKKMNQSQMQVAQTSQSHCDFSCLIAVEKQLNGIKFASLQKFTISTRIFYQSKHGFNYICQFFPSSNQKQQQGRLTLQRNECKTLQRKCCHKYQKENIRKVVQLHEEIQIVDIYIEELNQQITKNQEAKDEKSVRVLQNDRNRDSKHLSFLEEKLDIIQKMIMQTKQKNQQKWTKNRGLQLVIYFLIIVALVSAFLVIQAKINILEHANNQKQLVKNSCLARNKMMLSQLIMRLLDTNLYPANICKHSFGDLYTYLEADLGKDFLYGFDSLLNLIMSDFGTDTIDSAFYLRSNYSQTYLSHIQTNVTFFQYIHLLKSYFSQWLNQQSQQSTESIDLQYYAKDFPLLLQKYSFYGPDSPYPLINLETERLTSQLTRTVVILKLASCILCGLLIFTTIVLRLWDAQKILDYISILQNSPYGFLKLRQRELSYTKNLLQKLRYSYIYEIQVQADHFNVRSNQKILETINDQSIFRKKVESEKLICDSKAVVCEEEDLAFLGNRNKVNYADISTPHKLKSIANYNKNYLFAALLILLASTWALPSRFELYLQNLQQIQSYDKVTTKLSQISYHYINLVAYNWLKTTSLATAFNTSTLDQLFNDTILQLRTADYENTLIRYYDRETANQRLYQDSCGYLSDPQQCNQYRNGVFNSGSSVLLPLTINQELEIQHLQLSFTQLIPNLCDKTFLFYKIVVQFEKKLPLKPSQYAYSNAHALKELGIYFCIGLLIVLTFICQASISRRQNVVLKQLLSLDYVQKLYAINEFKPLFNKLFYQ